MMKTNLSGIAAEINILTIDIDLDEVNGSTKKSRVDKINEYVITRFDFIHSFSIGRRMIMILDGDGEYLAYETSEKLYEFIEYGKRDQGVNYVKLKFDVGNAAILTPEMIKL